jgi:hypothetical protein
VIVEELLAANRIDLPSIQPGRYYATCPQCSAKRTKANQRENVREVLAALLMDEDE